jgi:hypothetical protein
VPFGTIQHICCIHAHIFQSPCGQLLAVFYFPPSLVLWQLVVSLLICMHLKINLLLFHPGHQVFCCEIKLYNCTFFSFSLRASPLAIKTIVVCIKIDCVIVADFLITENSLVREI